MSIRSNCLTLRNGDLFIIDPYSPHRFIPQFGFSQDAPCRLDQDFHEVSLEDGLRFARIFVLTKINAKATFPPSRSNMKKLLLLNYKSWWEKVHRSFLENHMQSLMNVVGHVIDALQEYNEEVLLVNKPLILKSKKKLKDIKALRHAAKKGVEEVESKVSDAEKGYHRRVDVSLVIANSSNDVEGKTEA
ncbi:hypothetical protein HAX54_044603 [Datura stramonium]|uniref:Uncharacterized protein n=1 Tax=Datura stramonium TaxID=4076 RepID=A0ABS8WJN3_DATST|nr:hypothetical protein [Datura stramonium]